MDSRSDGEDTHDHLAGCVLRLFWMLVGNAILLACVASMVKEHSRPFGGEDVFYLSLVGCLLAARYVDIRYFRGRTADGEPASMADWRRYAVRVVIVATGLWLLAHSIVATGLLTAVF